MWNKIFDPENSGFRLLSKLVDLVGLSLLWAFLSIPIVTLLPVSAALYYSTVKCLRRGEEGAFRNFFRGLRLNLSTGLLLGLPLCLVMGLLLWSFRLVFWMAREGDVVMAFFYAAFRLVMICLAGILWTLAALLSRFSLGPIELLQKGTLFAVRRLPLTVLMAFLILSGGQLMLERPVFLLVMPALLALLSSLFLEEGLAKLVGEA